MLPGDVPFQRFVNHLRRFGWGVIRVKGGHLQLAHADRPGETRTVYGKHGRVSRMYMRWVLKDMGIDEEEFARKL